MNKIWKPKLSNHQGFKIGDGCILHSHTWVGKKVKIGNKVKIQAFVFICDGVILEDNVFIGPGVVFTNDKYPPSYGHNWSETLVKKGVSIGANATILPGITIGENALIGAGAVITKNVPPGEVWCGNPARFLKKR